MSDNLTCPAGQPLKWFRDSPEYIPAFRHLDGATCFHQKRSGKERRVWCARGNFSARPGCITGYCGHPTVQSAQLFTRRGHPYRRGAQAAKPKPAPDFIGDGPGEIGTQWDPYD